MDDINWHVVNNGLNFLESSVEFLENGDARQAQYAALHLGASIETLLKARLAREHWSLAVADPGKAQRKKYESGEAASATIDQTIERLIQVAGVDISNEDHRRIKNLNKTRNKIAHFALLGENPLATRATVARAMEALIRFIERELAPGAPGKERKLIDSTLAHVMAQVREIDELAKERMKSLQSTISASEVPVVTCPECLQDAYHLSNGEPGKCVFCSCNKAGDVVASDYASNVLGEDEYRAIKYGGEWIVHHCHICGEEALVDGVIIKFGPQASIACFACGYFGASEDVEPCARCGEWISAETDGSAICSNCMEWMMSDD